MTKRKIALITAVFLISLAAHRTLAAGASSCGPKQRDFEELKSVQNDSSLGYLEEIKAELNIRRRLLTATVDCAIKEASDLKAGLDNFKADDKDIRNIQANLSSDLGQTIDYYGLQKAKVRDLGIRGSEEFARNLKDWRENNYKPGSERVVYFLLWAKNQNLIQITRGRMDQVQGIINLLKLIEISGVQGLFEDARVNFQKSLEANEAAKISFQNYSNPDESLALVKNSLDALSGTYKKFFDIIKFGSSEPKTER